MDDGHFDEAIAATYDEDPNCAPEVVGPIVERLAGLAAGGPVLEFAIGTGRIGLPLALRGLEVHGIERSAAMLRRLAAKEGAERVHTTRGDMARTRVAGEFRLVCLVYNTIMNLTTQEQQVACFANAAAHLAPGGRFVVEVMLPRLQRVPPGEPYHVFHGSDDHMGIDEYDIATQGLISHHIWRQDGALHRKGLHTRYVWPAELDLMARLAGLEVEERWGGWQGEPFTSDSSQHVSVWRRPSAPSND